MTFLKLFLKMLRLHVKYCVRRLQHSTLCGSLRTDLTFSWSIIVVRGVHSHGAINPYSPAFHRSLEQ